MVFSSAGKTKYPGFKATFETKKSTEAILRIVGISVGVLSILCALTGCCTKYCGCCKDDEPGGIEGTSGDQAVGVSLQEATTKV